MKINTKRTINFISVTVLLICFNSLLAQHNWIRTNPGGGGSTSMVIATANGTILSGSDLSGVYKSNNNGQSWEVLGSKQGLTETHITCLAADYNSGNTFFIGTGLGIYKTTNGGNNIYSTNISTINTNGLGYVEAIEMAPSNSMVGYAAHYEWWQETLAFLKTTDGGENWNIVSTVGLPTNAAIQKMMVAYNNPNIIYALTGKTRYRCSEPWLYKSIDGGANWNRLALAIGDILDFDLHYNNSDILYASTFLAKDCSSPMWNYVDGDESSGKLCKSINGGFNFAPIGEETGFISVGFNDNEIALTNYLFPVDYNTTPPSYSSIQGTWKTFNGGNTWTKTGNIADWFTGWPQLNYAYSTSFYGLSKTITKNRFNPNQFYASYGGFAWSSLNGGDNFENISTNQLAANQHISTGMDNINGNSLDVSDANPNTIYAAYYDLGFWYSKDQGSSWTFSIPDYTQFPDHVWGGGGGSNANFVLNDPQRESVVWATFGVVNSATKGAIFKSTQYGENWQWSNNGLAYLGDNTHGMSLDINSPVNNRTLFVTQNGDVYKSTDDGNSWLMVLENGGLKFTEVDKFNSQLVYAGGENGLWRSTNGGNFWYESGLPEMRFTQQITGSVMRKDIVPTGSDAYSSPPKEAWNGVFEIKADPNIANTVYAVVYGKNKGLYKSENAGVNWRKLYTNDYLRGIAIDPNNSNRLYISSSLAYHSGGYHSNSLGVLYSEDGGANWYTANENMSWLFAGRMEIETGNNPHIWAWSPGTGIQYAALPNNNNLGPHILTANNSIKIQPNPYTNKLVVAGIFYNYSIKILDVNGNIFADYSNTTSPLNINLNDLNAGLYFLEITNNQNQSISVVKMISN